MNELGSGPVAQTVGPGRLSCQPSASPVSDALIALYVRAACIPLAANEPPELTQARADLNQWARAVQTANARINFKPDVPRYVYAAWREIGKLE